MMDILKLNENLLKIGLSREEIDVILYLAKNGDSKIADISSDIKIARSTIYRLIDDIEQKGIVKKILTKQGNKIALSNLENLRNQIADKQAELKKQLDQFDELTSTVLSLGQPNNTSPEIRYFEGKEGVRQIIWNTLKSESYIRCYTNAIRKDIVGAKWLTDYCLRFVNNNLEEKVLGDEIYAKDSYQKYGGREKYYLPVKEYILRSDERISTIPFLKIKGEIYIYNNVFAFYTWEGNKLIGTEIQSEFMSITQTSIFDVLWNLTKQEDSIDRIAI